MSLRELVAGVASLILLLAIVAPVGLELSRYIDRKVQDFPSRFLPESFERWN